MKQLLYQYLTRVQVVLFSCCFILAIAYPFKYIGEIHPLVLLVMAPIIIMVMNKLLSAIDRLKHIYRWLIVLYSVLVMIQLLLFILLPSATAYNDGAQIRNEALSLYYTGAFSGERYFLTYPNNINITLLLFWAYRLLSPLSFYTIEHIMTFISYHMMLLSMLIVTYRQFNIYQVVKLLMLFVITLPLHIYLLYFYTDTMVWWVPAMILLVVGWRRDDQTINYLQMFMLLVLLVLGYMIKQNIILLLPALMIYLWYRGFWKKALLLMMTFILAVQLVSPVMMNVQAKYGFYQNDHYRFPYVHWVMMGISESTFYNWHDYQYTYQQPTYDAKVAADLQLIKERIFERPVWRTLLVPFISLDTSWSEGTLYSVNSVRVNTEGNTPVWSWLLGHQRQLLLYFMQLTYIALLINIVSSLFHMKHQHQLYVLIQVTLLGVMTFHMFWESNPRYIVIWYPFMLLLSLNQPIKLPIQLSAKKLAGILGIMSGIVIIWSSYRPHYVIYHDYFVKTGEQNSAYATDYYLQQQSMIQSSQSIQQTFDTRDDFNFMTIVATAGPNSRYQVQLQEQLSGKIVWESTITQADFHDNKKIKTSELKLQFNMMPPGKYQLILTRLSGQWQVALSPNRYVDRYVPGHVQIDQQILPQQDLIFAVGKE